MRVRREAAEGFERAAAYERGRLTYPPAAVDWMVARLGITASSTVIDLGAGTGKFTRMLLPTGARIIAVEPVAAMRAELARLVPGVDIRDGTAEDIPCADGSANAVTAAQAFHWFSPATAVDEIHRVVREGGSLGLIWNTRALDDPVQSAIESILERYRGEAPVHEGNRWRQVLPGSRFVAIDERRFAHEQSVTIDGLLDRVLSTSFIAALDDEKRAAVEREIRALAAAQPRFVLPYVTDVFLFRRS